VQLTLHFYNFCGFRSVAVNSVHKLQFLHIYVLEMQEISHGRVHHGSTGACQVWPRLGDGFRAPKFEIFFQKIAVFAVFSGLPFTSSLLFLSFPSLFPFPSFPFPSSSFLCPFPSSPPFPFLFLPSIYPSLDFPSSFPNLPLSLICPSIPFHILSFLFLSLYSPPLFFQHWEGIRCWRYCSGSVMLRFSSYRQHCAAQSAGIFRLLGSDFEVFRLAEATHYTDGVKFGVDESTESTKGRLPNRVRLAKFHPHRCRGGRVRPLKLIILPKFWHINAPQGRIPWAIFTKF